MLNLLPPEQKKIIRREYFYHWLKVVLVFIFSLTCLSLVFLLPSLFLSTEKEKGITERSQVLKTLATVIAKRNYSDILKNLKEKVILLAPVQNLAGGLIDKIIADKNPGIQINQFGESESANNWNIQISGTASNRQTLLSFSDTLRAEKAFSKVDLPLSNFAKDTNIDFTISLQSANK